MKFYEFIRPEWGRAFTRISNALHRYSPPGTEWVNDYNSADMFLVHVVGGGEVEVLDRIFSYNKPVVIAQHTYFTSGWDKWDQFWNRSRLTVSFHDLTKYTDLSFPFLRSPWGVEADIFKKFTKGFRPIKVFTTGHVAGSELIDVTFEACKATQNFLYHTGENFKWGLFYKHLDYMDDDKLVALLNSTQYVTGLRDFEGFEMMAIEGFFCGAIPVVPDLPTYDWYRDFSKMIDMKKDVKTQLIDIFNKEPEVINNDLYEDVRNRFRWETVVGNIYKAVGE